jgi:hypothetical protein
MLLHSLRCKLRLTSGPGRGRSLTDRKDESDAHLAGWRRDGIYDSR